MIKTKIKTETFFFIGYVLMLAGQMFSNVIFIEHYINYLTYLGFLFLVVYIIINKNKYTNKNIIFLLLCTLFFTIVSIVTNDKKMLKLMSLIIAFQNINFEKFIKKDFTFRSIFLIIVVFLNLLGFTHNNDVTRIGESTIRYALGFHHPNTFAVYTMMLGLEFIYLNRTDKKIKSFIFVIIIFGLNYFLTDSRAAMIIEILMIIYLTIPSNVIQKLFENKIIKNGITLSFLILLFLSLFLTFNYSKNNNLLYKVNELTSSRIMLANMYIKKYSVFSLFGQEISETNRFIDSKQNPNYIPLDNGYVHLILKFGFLTTIIFFLFYFIALKRLYENKNYILIFIIFILNLYLVMEATTIGVIYNPFLLVFATTFYDYIEGIDIKNIENKNTLNNKKKVKLNES